MCYTGRSSASEQYICFLGDYTAMTIFSSNTEKARREVEGSEVRKSTGVAAERKMGWEVSCG